jgi:hypothetical protein
MKTEIEILEQTYEQWYKDCQEQYPGCSPNQPSFSKSSVDGNLVTLRNGGGMLCQYNITKNGELKKLR